MNAPVDSTDTPPPAPSITHHRAKPALVWLVPIIAALVGVSMLVHAWMSTGPRITINFATAAGLEAGKTVVKYKDVTVGSVDSITLAEDGSSVVVEVILQKGAESLAREGSRFWVVRPRIGLGGVSGFDTLISGAYIGVDAGMSEKTQKTFEGLENPPAIVQGMAGKTFMVKTTDLGSLDIGSPVYYRRVHVGKVTSYKLDNDGRHVNLQIFVEAPYDRFVTVESRFWNASGIDLSMNAEGMHLTTQSLTSVLSGGIAFANLENADSMPAPENASFMMLETRQAAMAPPDGEARYVELRFQQSMRGLAVGAPVELYGLDIGKVLSIDMEFDPQERRIPVVVGVEIYPRRLDRVLDRIPQFRNVEKEDAFLRLLKGMVERGLRAQVRIGNLLTGKLFIALDFDPKASKVNFDVNARPITIPTMTGNIDKLQEQIAGIVDKLDKIPFESIGNNLNNSAAELDAALKRLNRELLPETRATLQQAGKTLDSVQGAVEADSPLQASIAQTLEEVQRASRALRLLVDAISRQPQSLIFGRSTEQEIPGNTARPLAVPAADPEPQQP